MSATTTKVATNNIFASLQDDSDNEAPAKVTAPVAHKNAPKAAENKPAVQQQNQPDRQRGQRRDGTNANEERPRKENNRRPKEEQKVKGVSGEPHPLDRHSGTGYSGVDKKAFRKDGASRGNYRATKQEVESVNKDAPVTEVQPAVVEVQEEQEPVVVDNTITVEEYFAKFQKEEEPAQKAPERKINLDELKRDKLVVVSSKTEKVLDQNVIKAASSKKNKGPSTYSVGCNTDNSHLLGVTTGHTLVKYTVSKEGDQLVGEEKRVNKEAQQPREDKGPRGERAPRENKGPRGPREENRGPKTNQNKGASKKANVENEADFPSLA